MAKEPFKDPFPNLSRPSLFASKRETDKAKAPPAPISIDDVVEKMAGSVARGAEFGMSENLKSAKVNKSSGRQSKTKPVVSEPKKRGPKPKGDPEPWKTEGVSRRTYFRRQKALKESGS